MPEDGALHQSLWHGGTIDRDERSIATLTLLVNGAGNQLLTGSRLTLNQHRRASRRHRTYHLEHPPDCLPVAQNLPTPAKARQFLAERLVLFPEANHLERLGHGDSECFLTHGLGEVVDRAASERHDRMLHRGVSGHDDDRDPVSLLFQLRQQVETRGAGHPIVRDDQLELLPTNGLHRFVDAVCQDRRMTKFRQRRLENDANRRLVIDAQDGCHAPPWCGSRFAAFGPIIEYS